MCLYKIALTCCFLLLSSCGDWIDYSPVDMYSAGVTYDDANAPRHLSVAAVSLHPAHSDKAANLDSISVISQRILAAHPDVQVIVFGEMILGWYWDDKLGKTYQQQVAEPIPGPSSKRLAALSDSLGVALVWGMAELDSVSGLFYNSQVLVKPSGELIKYRKRNLNETDKDNGITSADSTVVTDLDGVRVGLFICSDMQSNNVTSDLLKARPEVILQSLTSTTDLSSHVSYVGTQLNTWIVFANRFGTEGDIEYTGFSHIINPAGTIESRVTGENAYVYRRLGIW